MRDPYYFQNGASRRQGALLLVVRHALPEPAFQRRRSLYFARVRPGAKQAKYAVATTAAPVASTLQDAPTHTARKVLQRRTKLQPSTSALKSRSKRLNPKNSTMLRLTVLTDSVRAVRAALGHIVETRPRHVSAGARGARLPRRRRRGQRTSRAKRGELALGTETITQRTTVGSIGRERAGWKFAGTLSSRE